MRWAGHIARIGGRGDESSVWSRWHRWSGHCAASRQFACYIADWNFSHYDPGSTQPLTEMSTRNISCGVGRRADNFTTFICRLSWNQWVLTSWNPQGPSRPVIGLLYSPHVISGRASSASHGLFFVCGCYETPSDVETGPGAHPTSCKIFTGSFPGVKCGLVCCWPLTPF